MQNEGFAVIGAGFGRTGTLSLKSALEQLGFDPCYHMIELFQHPEHLPYWEKLARGETIDWRELFANYRASLDWPACTFYKEQMQAFPNAKVILTVRDPERWYESVRATIYQSSNNTGGSPLARLLMRAMRLTVPQMRSIKRVHEGIIWGGTFNGRLADKNYAIAIFDQHIEEVINIVPPEKLLVYNVKEGWEPLCAFLGAAVPEQPFPHLNDRASFPGNQRVEQMERTARIVGGSAIAAFALLAALFFLRRQRS